MSFKNDGYHLGFAADLRNFNHIFLNIGIVRVEIIKATAGTIALIHGRSI